MKQFRVQVTNGSYDAPEMYLESGSHSEAEKEATKRSGLGRFNSWKFIAREIKK